jgi:dihydroxyacetone kinase
VKNEELYVVFDRLAVLLEDAGATIVDPQVGEFCTSFDMAGASLTLFWLDEELERLWSAPADTPAFRTGAVDTAGMTIVPTGDDDDVDDEVVEEIPEAGTESKEAAARVIALLAAVRDVIDENVDELGRIDAVAGDGDHGIGMQRGARAAVDAATRVADAGAGSGKVLTVAANAWSDRAGGTSGALWGIILTALGGSVGDEDAPNARSVSAGVSAAKQAVMEFGKAEVGDKTIVDALVPFADTLASHVEAGEGFVDAWSAAASEATRAADATADLLPLIGRARSHGEKALGVRDPGAVSMALIANRVSEVLTSWRSDG